MMGKFKRAWAGRRESDMDVIGNVRVQVWLVDPANSHGALKSNLRRSMTVSQAKVSDVVAAIEKALFDD
jgi:hypothetical protein